MDVTTEILLLDWGASSCQEVMTIWTPWRYQPAAPGDGARLHVWQLHCHGEHGQMEPCEGLASNASEELTILQQMCRWSVWRRGVRTQQQLGYTGGLNATFRCHAVAANRPETQHHTAQRDEVGVRGHGRGRGRQTDRQTDRQTGRQTGSELT